MRRLLSATIGMMALLGLAAGYAAVSTSATQPATDGDGVAAGQSDKQQYHMKADRPDDEVRYSASGYDITPLSAERIEALAVDLDHDAFEVLIQCGTEQPGSGALLNNDEAGVYCCRLCGLPLFRSDHKFDSGTGWPSYFQTYDPEHVLGVPDHSLGMERTETVCARCDAHLGHVFKDGPELTNLRFCINSLAMTFYEHDEPRPSESRPVETETAYFAGGCFWGIEYYFGRGEGVLKAVSGYMQGDLDDPAYRDVVTGRTGHAESVKVVFDPVRISYERLLEAFFVMHDPTQLNRQGPDVGTHYRSGIWYANDAQRREARAFLDRLKESGEYDGDIVTELEAAETFWRAEDEHQNYIERTGRACNVPDPWK